jgi:hypothetical protein
MDLLHIFILFIHDVWVICEKQSWLLLEGQKVRANFCQFFFALITCSNTTLFFFPFCSCLKYTLFFSSYYINALYVFDKMSHKDNFFLVLFCLYCLFKIYLSFVIIVYHTWLVKIHLLHWFGVSYNELFGM